MRRSIRSEAMPLNYWLDDNRYYDRSDRFCRGRALSLGRPARLSARSETGICRSPGCAAGPRCVSRLVAGMVWFIFTT